LTRSVGWALALAAGLFVTAGCGRQEAPGPKTVNVSVTEDGFEPSRIEATKGEMLTLVVTRRTDDTCAKEIVVGQGEIRKDLPLHEPVTVQFVPAATGEIRFACAMGMYGGTIVVK
jgi:plastocyanin domain-containing protein